MSLERMFDLLEEMHGTASVQAVFGEPQEVEGRILIPVAAVRTGFGMGFGELPADQEPEDQDAEEGKQSGGSGGSARVRPVALIEVTPQQTVIKPILDETKVALAGLGLVAWIVFWVMATVQAVFGAEE
jgi:uncharacterized spore protein YtfJ